MIIIHINKRIKGINIHKKKKKRKDILYTYSFVNTFISTREIDTRNRQGLNSDQLIAL